MPDEYVRLMGIRPGAETKAGHTVVKFVQHIDEIEDFVNKYKHNFNLFIGLGIYKGQTGDANSITRRKVVFLDFDMKDYSQYTEIADFTAHVKRQMPSLFNHCIVASGNGVHLYISTQPTKDIARLVRINRNIAKIVGADLKAVKSTQQVRLPTSLNLKGERKPVNVVSNNITSDKYKPYALNRLEKMIQFKKYSLKAEEVLPLPPTEYKKTSSYNCVEKMLASGCKQGERNFCLGRITKYLKDVKGYRYDDGLKKVLEWNRRCAPPKTVEEVTTDFHNYWNSDYKLLGCTISDPADRAVLDRYCNKFNCTTIVEEVPTETQLQFQEIKFDNHLVENKELRKLRGYHYLILSILHLYPEGLTVKQIKEVLTNQATQKCCISNPTLRTNLKDLTGKYIQCNDYGAYTLKDIKNFGMGYTRLYYAASLLLINGIIHQQDYLVYICLVRNLNDGKSVTYESISNDLSMDKSIVGRHIRQLHKSKVLIIDKGYNDKGLLYNTYRLTA